MANWKKPYLLGVVAAGAALSALFIFFSGPVQSQTSGDTNTGIVRMSESSVDQNHMHTLGMTADQIDGMIAGLPNEDDEVSLDSSTNFDNGQPSGVVHSHVVKIKKSDLRRIKNGELVSIECEEALGHKHIFVFVTSTQCPVMVTPIPIPTVTVTVRPSNSPRPSPSPSVSPSPSPSPSVSPHPSPSAAPSSNVSPHPIGSPFPGAGPIFSPGPVRLPPY
ncbi:MAG: hypothetical protein ACXWPM_01805 [Bdellovibrionota bacterium]